MFLEFLIYDNTVVLNRFLMSLDKSKFLIDGHKDSSHHNCRSQNCPACCRTRRGKEPGYPNFAVWLTPQLECNRCHIKFYGSDCFAAHQQKSKKKGVKSICERYRECLSCCSVYQLDPKIPHECFHATCANCKEFQHVDHCCFIQLVEKKSESDIQESGNEEPDF